MQHLPVCDSLGSMGTAGSVAWTPDQAAAGSTDKAGSVSCLPQSSDSSKRFLQDGVPQINAGQHGDETKGTLV
jgi:hypothetical protein